MQPLFPFSVGIMYNGGIQNGVQVYTQPGGPGSPVSPQPPQTSPPSTWQRTYYKPTYPFVYVGLLNFICGHWANTCEVFTVYDPYNDCQAALCCCPVCSMIQLIVEPASDWFQTFYSLYPLGLQQPGGGLLPSIGG
jgi:hypothetical protein